MDVSPRPLRIRVLRGTNLAVRDILRRSSDPYVVLTMDNQKVKTRVIKRSCNPEWNDEVTLALSASNPVYSIHLVVYDRDRFSRDDEMGEAEIDLRPYLLCADLTKKKLMNQGNNESKPKDGALISSLLPSKHNCLARRSCIFWRHGRLVQRMLLCLKNVECGEVELEMELLNFFP